MLSALISFEFVPVRDKSSGLEFVPVRDKSSGPEFVPVRDKSSGLELVPVRDKSSGLEFVPVRDKSSGLEFVPVRDKSSICIDSPRTALYLLFLTRLLCKAISAPFKGPLNPFPFKGKVFTCHSRIRLLLPQLLTIDETYGWNYV